MQARRRVPLNGTASVNRPFNDLKTLCTTAPILEYGDFTKPFKLHTDACGTGLGAVLYQTREDGTKAVIAYASRSLNKAESHYPAHKLEFLTLKWAVVKKFHEYLYGSTFDVYTDNNLLILCTNYSQAGCNPAIAGSPVWQITISECTIRQAKPTLMPMLYLEYLGWSACLTIWVPV